MTFIQTIEKSDEKKKKKLKQNVYYHKINILAEKAQMIFYAFLNHFSQVAHELLFQYTFASISVECYFMMTIYESFVAGLDWAGSRTPDVWICKYLKPNDKATDLFDLRVYVPVNNYGHVDLATLFLGRFP